LNYTFQLQKVRRQGKNKPKTSPEFLGKAPIRASQPCWLFLNNDNKVITRNKEQMNHTLFPFHFSPNKPLMPQLNFSWKRHHTYLSSEQQSTSQKKNAIYKALMRYQTHIPFLISRLKSGTGKKKATQKKNTLIWIQMKQTTDLQIWSKQTCKQCERDLRFCSFVSKWINVPAVLKPDFDLFGLNVRENRTLSNKLLSSQRTRLRTFCIHSLQCLNLLRCIPHILTWIHVLVLTVYRKRHKNQQKHLIKENQHRPPRCCFEMLNNNKLKERGVSFFVPLMKKGESLVWFLCVFFNVGGGSSSRVSVGFHRQALSFKRATSLVHQTQR